MKQVLTVTNLVKTFPLSKKQRQIQQTKQKQMIAVNSLSFSLEKGEVFGLLGTNGAGKTTALRMIATLIKPNSGTINVNGIDGLREPAKVRSQIGFLTSELKLEDFFTPNDMYDYFSQLHGVPPETVQSRKQKLFSCLGIDQFAEVKIGDLSTGMKQKVSIAVSIVHDPDVIIFDEPTNGLDIITSKAVTDFLLTLKAEGKTILVSSHIFALIEKICDRVGIMMNGKMVCVENVAEIQQRTTLEERFFEIHNRIQEETHHA